MRRVLTPGGAALFPDAKQGWSRITQPFPPNTGTWSHYLHGPDNNAVDRDPATAPPRACRWTCGPRSTRHHEFMSSFSAMVSQQGRIFYIMDLAPGLSMDLPPDWRLVARDAFNGLKLWERSLPAWHPHTTRFKSGPATLPRRLVALDNRVYATLGLHAPVSALDAASGATKLTFTNSECAEEILATPDLLVCCGRSEPSSKWWAFAPRWIKAYDPRNGALRWQHETPLMPLTLAMDKALIYFSDSKHIRALDRETGETAWTSEPVASQTEFPSWYAPVLVVHDKAVLYACADPKKRIKGKTAPPDRLIALDPASGQTLWSVHNPKSGHASTKDVLVINDTVWISNTASWDDKGFFGFNLADGQPAGTCTLGKPEVRFPHQRCYRQRASGRYLLGARTGLELYDPDDESLMLHNWIRGACLYGMLPSYGTFYIPPNPCACFLDAKLNGFYAVTVAPPALPSRMPEEQRLVRGPAYNTSIHPSEYRQPKSQWPTFRGDNQRRAWTAAALPLTAPALRWAISLPAPITPPTVAEGIVFVALPDQHEIRALDAVNGTPRWSFTAGGRIDSPPTIYRGSVYFGARDGWIYSLNGSDGALRWRRLAAPADRSMMAYDQPESVWPLHGSVLIQSNRLYAVAGRSMFLDKGLRMLVLDLETGAIISENTYADKAPDSGKELQAMSDYMNMPVASPDILSGDGRHIYMRGQAMDADGRRLFVEQPFGDVQLGSFGTLKDYAKFAAQQKDTGFKHLFSPTGFLNDPWFHRTYLMYGNTYSSSAFNWFRAGAVTPAGKTLAMDEAFVYGYGRNPECYRWIDKTTYRLFKAYKDPDVIPLKTRGPSQASSRFATEWEHKLNLHVHAMLLAPNALVIAGSPKPEEPARQLQAWHGERGGLLQVRNPHDGRLLHELPLEAPPVHEGLAAAHNRSDLDQVQALRQTLLAEDRHGLGHDQQQAVREQQFFGRRCWHSAGCTRPGPVKDGLAATDGRSCAVLLRVMGG